MRKAEAAKAIYIQGLLGPGFTVFEFDESTRTAEDAATAIGCTVPQIAKSLLFKAENGDPVLVIASGTNRVDEKKVRDIIGQKIKRADADFVKEKTGFSIGGVSPIGHATTPITLIDRDLLQYETIWAAGGTPNAVFELNPNDLEGLTGGAVGNVAKA